MVYWVISRCLNLNNRAIVAAVFSFYFYLSYFNFTDCLFGFSSLGDLSPYLILFFFNYIISHVNFFFIFLEQNGKLNLQKSYLQKSENNNNPGASSQV